MKAFLIASTISLLCLLIGFVFRKDPYVLKDDYQPYDQLALDHRDSPYSHVSWVVSEIGNFAHLRFFDKVEGGVALHPSWATLQTLPGLEHLVPEPGWSFIPSGGATWPAGRPHPDFGSLPTSKYVCLYPAAVLLNQKLMNAAGNDPRQAAPNILVIGLGSGVGISVFAHHFPEATITVVDIDQAVIDLVNEHYPLFRWLQTQTTSSGEARLRVRAMDARQYVAYPRLRADQRPFDIVVLDAYTSGSTIPSHLMTREFYAEVAASLTDHGILLSNIIGSYTGAKRLVLGGAMRSMQESGLEHVWNVPIVSAFDQPPLSLDETRNNIVLASRQPLHPRQRAAAWQRLRSFELFPELPEGRYTSELLLQIAQPKETLVPTEQRAGSWGSSAVAITDPTLRQRLAHFVRKQHSENMRTLQNYYKEARVTPYSAQNDDNFVVEIDEPGLAADLRAAARAIPEAHGWTSQRQDLSLRYLSTDWVLHARRTWQRAITAAAENVAGRMIHDGDVLVGSTQERVGATLPDAPLFTDVRPNADILNR